MNNTFHTIINWILQTQNLITLISIAVAIPAYIRKVRQAKGKSTIEKIILVAKEEANKLLYEDMSNAQKRDELENRVMNLIPAKQLNRVGEEKVKILLEGVYHAVTKPENEDKNIG